MRGKLRVLRLALLVALASSPPAARAGTLAGVLRDPLFRRLGLAPIAPALADTVASTYPIASASANVTYEYNPVLDILERRGDVNGPVIGERAETLGRRQFNLGISYSYVRLSSINGQDLSDLLNRTRVNGRTLTFRVPGGVTLADGRFTNVLPVRVQTDLDVEAHILSPSLTYGLSPDIDVNITLPLLRTSLGVTALTRVPDPRLPQFTLPPGNPNAQRSKRSLSDDAVGVGDLLLRTKYMLWRSALVDVAAGLALSLPTGDDEDLQGTGATRVQPALIVSRVFADHVEPLLNLGVDFDTEDVDRSVVRWAVGATWQALEPFSVSLVFLGRQELGRQTEPIAVPFFFQIERNDIYDASVGFRWRFAPSGSVALNAIVPLNDQGLRPEAIPTLEVEYAF